VWVCGRVLSILDCRAHRRRCSPRARPRFPRRSRERREPSPWRDRPAAESLALFEDMRRGLVDEGGATLRMRQDHRNDNFNMFDLIAYRIKFVEHPHAGDKW
jgi:glutaminyl-tRNA synthetase